MPQTKTCPKCGAELPADAPAGICPKCLMQAGLASDQDAGSNPQSTPTTRTSAFVPPEPEALAKHFPQLEILELLGKGGMGAVYKARQPGLDRFVAVKILPPEVGADPAFAERFMREARALAKLSHQNIVSVFDFGQADGLYYFVMEYVDGANLRHLIETGAIKPEEALAIVPQICEALQFAHDEGIVHRDIKPENILLDKQGRVKIADFGLAKLLGNAPDEAALTGTHQAMGTLHYMAPEQMRGAGSVDHRADIYSLGVVFYEMLTGQLPIGKFEPPSKKVQIDVRLDEIVLRSLESEPDRRYQHVSEVKMDVETISSSATRAASEQQRSVITLPPAFQRVTGHWAGRLALLVTAILVGYAGYKLFLPDVSEAMWTVVLVLSLLGFLVDVLRHPGRLKGLQAAFPLLAGLTAMLIYFIADPETLLNGLYRIHDGTPSKDDPTFLRVIIGVIVASLIWQMIQVRKKITAQQGGTGGLSAREPAQGRVDQPPVPPAAGHHPDVPTIMQQVKGPATGLLITGILNWIGIPVVAGILTLTALHQDLPLPHPEQMVPAIALFMFVASGLMIFGALKMRKLEAYGAAIASSILAMIVSPGSVVGFPIGIWALVVLTRREVKAAFAAKKKSHAPVMKLQRPDQPAGDVKSDVESPGSPPTERTSIVSDDKGDTTLKRAWAEWWLQRDRFTTNAIKAVLLCVFFACLAMFFTFEASASSEGLNKYQIGVPSPWFTVERHASGSSYGVTIFSSSFLVAAVGLLAYYVYTRIKRAELGPEAKIIPVQVLICGILLAVAVGMVVAPLLLGTLTAE